MSLNNFTTKNKDILENIFSQGNSFLLTSEFDLDMRIFLQVLPDNYPYKIQFGLIVLLNN
jgi:hypothetical protein